MYYSLFNQDLVDYVYFFCLYARLYLIVVWTDNFHGAIYCGSSPWHCIFIYNVFLDPISFFSSSWWVLILISQLIMAFELMVLSFKPNLTFLSLWDGGISLTSINVRYFVHLLIWDTPYIGLPSPHNWSWNLKLLLSTFCSFFSHAKLSFKNTRKGLIALKTSISNQAV